MSTLTAFCTHVSGIGTIWISTIEVGHKSNTVDNMLIAATQCAADWGCEPESIHVLGLAEGDVKILFWEDL